jgi:hypothetical protein
MRKGVVKNCNGHNTTQEEQPPHLAMITTQNLMRINIKPTTIGHGKWIYQQLKYTMDVLQKRYIFEYG